MELFPLLGSMSVQLWRLTSPEVQDWYPLIAVLILKLLLFSAVRLQLFCSSLACAFQALPCEVPVAIPMILLISLA